VAPKTWRWSTVLGFSALALLTVFALPLWDRFWAVLRPGVLCWQEPWRLLLGHWVHETWPHLALNGIALVGWMTLWRESAGSRALQIASVSVLTGAGICQVSDAAYVLGLSGLLHGLYVAAAIEGCRRDETRLFSVAVLVIVAGKLAAEQLLGPAAATEQLAGLPVATEAHWLGALAGTLYGIARWALPSGSSASGASAE